MIRIDPRTKIFMLFDVSAIVMLSATTVTLWIIRIAVTLIPLVLLIAEKRYKSAVRFLLLYAAALYITFYILSEQSTGFICSFLKGYCGVVVQFMPSFITAWYVIRTTKIDEFISAMERMHVPDGIIISLAVVMRFFPTIKEEYSSINDAMKMRGISMGNGSLSKIIEYRMVPLLFSCVNIGDELSAAAITKGLGGKVKRTSVVKLKLNIIDYILIFCFVVLTACFVFFKYFR